MQNPKFRIRLRFTSLLRRPHNCDTLFIMNSNLGASGEARAGQAPAATAAVVRWPAHFPSCCPPTDARDLQGKVYRLVATDPPTAADMLSALERGAFPKKDQCQRAALSCALTVEDLAAIRNNVPKLRDQMIAFASLSAADGKIKQTGRPGHYSMWLCASTLQNSANLFKVAT